MNHVLAIDIGGTKLAAALVDESGSVSRSATRPTPAAKVMAALAALVTEVTEDGPPPVAVGIGCAGPLNLAAGTVSPVNMPSWRDFPLRDEMRRLTGLPTVLAGDGQCFALGEHWLGSGHGSSALLGIVVSTGIGGGLVIDGVPLLGPTGNAGHVGHMSIDPYGERCSCGGRGCVERYASGPSLVRWALANGWQPGLATVPVTVEATIDTTGLVVSGSDTATSTLASHAGSGGPGGIALPAIDGRPRSDGIALSAMDGRTGTTLPAVKGRTGADGTALPALDGRTGLDGGGRAGSDGGGLTGDDGGGLTGDETGRVNARVLARDAAAGDAVALAAFERGGRALAGMIASTAAAAEVTMVVIGGGVSGAGPVLFEPLERALDDVAGLPFVRAVQVQPTMLGIRAGLAGAAKLAWNYSRSAN